MRVRTRHRRLAAGAAVVVALLVPIAVGAAGARRARAPAALCRSARDPRLTARPPAPLPGRGTAVIAVHDSTIDPVCAFANERRRPRPVERRRPRPAERRWRTVRARGRLVRLLVLARTRAAFRRRNLAQRRGLSDERAGPAPYGTTPDPNRPEPRAGPEPDATP
ncbi:hypothetical protein [Streptomyces cavernae]|uniref:hypothetical protein n=1 Tax=Streptomyces cavernae TaxID=2259034 RepID=UPI000FEC10FD|nr:hypothetical protein [Streptomyces cavernae]